MGVDRERMPESVTTRQLVTALEGRSRRFGAVEALKELGRRPSGPARTAALTRVVADESKPAELRTVAAVELGREANPEHQRALVAALRSDDPAVVRRAAEGLGRIGDETAFRTLKAMQTRREPVRRSIDFARTLLAYRLGRPENRLEPPAKSELMRVDRRRAVPLVVKRPSAKLLDAVLPRLTRDLPAISVGPEGALQFTCGDQQFLILLEQTSAALAGLSERPAVAGVVLKRSESLDRYYLYEYLLTHPEDGGTLRLFGVRPSGVVVHAGAARLGEGAARFELRALETRYSPPLRIEGDYENGKLAMPTALVHPDFTRAQKRQVSRPVKLGPPRRGRL